MLQTTKNQLTPDQIIYEYQKYIKSRLETAEYPNVVNLEDEWYVINQYNSPIGIYLQIFHGQYSITNKYFYICLGKNGDGAFYSIDLYCDKFTPEDITSLADLYIYMLVNNIREIPSAISRLSGDIIEPNQLSAIISEYLNERWKPNASNLRKSANAQTTRIRT